MGIGHNMSVSNMSYCLTGVHAMLNKTFGVLAVAGFSFETILTQQPQNEKVLKHTQEKKMALCETCGSFLVANDPAERTQSHVTGKQHIGYGMVWDFVNEFKNFILQVAKEKAREEERLARKKEAEEQRKQQEKEKEKENESRGRGIAHLLIWSLTVF
ncbi:luc7-like protein 3 [Telopea speciosissima]|uniref:luc7-like protein 3 n=1 Tax=Telopea speciosissima TaxID=54955 RepID=UPI001CC5E3F8|nr:luc7-like protein 3 [Telopea speciosissima]